MDTTPVRFVVELSAEELDSFKSKQTFKKGLICVREGREIPVFIEIQNRPSSILVEAGVSGWKFDIEHCHCALDYDKEWCYAEKRRRHPDEVCFFRWFYHRSSFHALIVRMEIPRYGLDQMKLHNRIPKGPWSLAQELKMDEAGKDFEFVSRKDESRQRVRSTVLAISGKYFKSLLKDAQDPSQLKLTAEHDYSEDTIRSIIRFLYFRELNLSNFTCEELLEMLDATKMMLLEDLFNECETELGRRVGEEDPWKMLMIARKYDLSRLRTKSLVLAAEDKETNDRLRKLGDLNLCVEFVEHLQSRK